MENTSEEPPDRRLKRVLGVFDTYALVHADSQSTFYFLAGFIALAAGGFAFLSTIYGVLLMAVIALVYGEMASRFPKAGGSYIYVTYAFGGTAGYLAAWLLALDQIVMIGYGVIDAAKVFNKVFGLFMTEVVLAAVFSTALFILTLLGVKKSANVAKIFAVVDLALMAALIITALALHPALPPFFKWGGIEGVNLLLAFSLLSRGFTGIDAVGQLAGEVKKPRVYIRKAMWTLVAIGAIQGLGLMAVITSALTPAELTDPAIAPLYLAEKIHPAAFYLMAFNIFAIMLMAALTGYLAFSRLLYRFAESSLLPEAFSRLHNRFKTPYISLALAYLISLALVYIGEVEVILAIYAIGSLINYLMVSLASAKMSKNRRFKTFAVWGIPIFVWAAVFLIPLGITLALLEKYRYIWALAVWIAAGLVLYKRKHVINMYKNLIGVGMASIRAMLIAARKELFYLQRGRRL
ncbi:MAG: APC family permease [Pyrobaculum sp.]